MQKKQSRLSIFTNGLVKENPLLVLSIGLCSSLAVTTNVFNGIGMGFSMMFVLVMSELIIAIFRNVIPEDIRLPIFIIVIAAFTTIVRHGLRIYVGALRYFDRARAFGKRFAVRQSRHPRSVYRKIFIGCAGRIFRVRFAFRSDTRC